MLCRFILYETVLAGQVLNKFLPSFDFIHHWLKYDMTGMQRAGVRVQELPEDMMAKIVN